MYSSVESPTTSTDKPGPSSVSEVSQLIQGLLKSDPQLASISIIGEVSGHSQPASGHSYFSLRDREASLRCVMFRYGRGHQYLEDGALVVCEGSAGIYAPRGDLQIIVTSAEPAGVGDQQAQLEELKRKLRAEGLFDPSRKRTIPQFPQRIAVITSEQGAVWHDIANVVRRRYPLMELTLVPSAVQGELAPVSIIEAFADLHAYAETETVDAVIVARGGGSAEDLMPYNDEMVARTIFASRIPVISAVGHETDFTIADDVADLRAPTPSAAAELVSPNASDLAVEIRDFAARVTSVTSERLHQNTQQFDLTQDRLVTQTPDIATRREHVNDMVARLESGWVRHRALRLETLKRFDEKRMLNTLEVVALLNRQRRDALLSRLVGNVPRLESYKERIADSVDRVSSMATRIIADKKESTVRVDEDRLKRAMSQRNSLIRQRLEAIDDRLVLAVPETIRSSDELELLASRLQSAMNRLLENLKDSLKPQNATMVALAPQKVLERGYAIVRNETGHIITRKIQVNQRDIMEITFADGEVTAEVLDADSSTHVRAKNEPRNQRKPINDRQAKFI